MADCARLLRQHDDGVAAVLGQLSAAQWGPTVQDKLSALSDFSGDIDLLSVLYAACIAVLITHTQPFNGPLSGTTRVGRYQKKHSPSHTHPDHQTSFINFLHLLRSIASSVFSLRADSLFPQPLSRSFLVFFSVLDPLLHTPCISSPNHHLYAAHAHTVTVCSAVIPVLCHTVLMIITIVINIFV